MNNYFKDLTDKKSKYSSKSWALIVSTITGALFAIMLGVAVIIDVSKDGRIDSSMSDLGVMLGADGLFMCGGSASKIAETIKNNE